MDPVKKNVCSVKSECRPFLVLTCFVCISAVLQRMIDTSFIICQLHTEKGLEIWRPLVYTYSTKKYHSALLQIQVLSTYVTVRFEETGNRKDKLATVSYSVRRASQTKPFVMWRGCLWGVESVCCWWSTWSSGWRMALALALADAVSHQGYLMGVLCLL